VDRSIEQIYEAARVELAAASSRDHANDISIRYLGRKGLVTQFLRNISTLPPEDRPAAGQKANEIKQKLDALLQETLLQLDAKQPGQADRIDVSLPGRPLSVGSLHPITQITRQISDIFTRLGFEIAEGPEVESDYFNFEALNIPKNHPARDMQDTFYMSENIVLRTHTSPIQVRYMEAHKPPLRIIAPGKVYRCDSDLTHTPMFHQVEGLLVAEGVTFGDLKGILTTFVHQMKQYVVQRSSPHLTSVETKSHQQL